MTTEGAVAGSAVYELRPVRVGADFILHRGFEKTTRKPVLAVSPASRPFDPLLRDRLEHEFSIAGKIDRKWAARPLEIIRHRDADVLILEDPGGTPLDALLDRQPGRRLELGLFLRIAVGLSQSLGQVHEQGLIHKDVKPENALVGDAGHVWLLGFGVAAELARQRQAPRSLTYIAGTLAYMSPEQTGRVNRSIDVRSDLYSLGATLFELLTGAPPFDAVEPMELIHCHIARQPPSVKERVPETPSVLSAIVEKLLAKSADDRYQSTAGLERDLQRCLDAWSSQNCIEDFALGISDGPARLVIPERLYGRSVEMAALKSACERIMGGASSELFLVGGQPGAGKSFLVREFISRQAPAGILFAATKFEAHLRNSPLACVAPALQVLVKNVLSRDRAEVQGWTRQFKEVLAANARPVMDLVPELGFVLGSTPPAADLPPPETTRRFQAVLRDFVGLFARPDHPLVLFLDDLQWVDRASLDLVEQLLVHADEPASVLIIGTYRQNEVHDDHRLIQKLATLRSKGAAITEVSLQPLEEEDLGRMICDALHSDPAYSRSLSHLVQGKTGGNPFFAIQFLHSLEDDGLLAVDRTNRRWIWDEPGIRSRNYSDNIVDLMVVTLKKLSTGTRDALCWLSCFSSTANIELLAAACAVTVQELHELLREAARAELVACSDDGYAFEHDRIKDASYSLIPEEMRSWRHLRIGRLLLADSSLEEPDAGIYKVVEQFSRGRKTIETADEILQVAKLNLVAAKLSKNSAEHAAALSYLREVDELLPPDRWSSHYAMAFDCELTLAECEFVMGDTASAEKRLELLADRAVTLIDQAAVACLRVDLYVVLMRPQRALQIGADFLQTAGFAIRLDPSDDDVRRAKSRVSDLMNGRMVEDLLDLPIMTDPNEEATINVLNRLVLSALYGNTTLHYLIILLMVEYSIRKGNSAASVLGYVSFGRFLITEHSEFQTGYRFGRLALDLIEKKELTTFKARAYFSFGTGVSSWSQHLRVGRSYLRIGLQEAKRNGDTLYVGYSLSNLVGNAISSGTSLDEVDRMAIDALKFALGSEFQIAAGFVLGQLRLTRSLTGLPVDFRGLEGSEFHADDFERDLLWARHPQTVSDIYWSRRLQALVFLGDYGAAIEAAQLVKTLLTTPWPNIEGAEYHFYKAIAYSRRLANHDGAVSPTDALERIREHHRRLEAWSVHSPDNLSCRAVLLGAEIARLEGRQADSEALFEKAIHLAREQGFVQVEALACEMAAASYGARGLREIQEYFLSKACEAYGRWGAGAVLRRMGVEPDDIYPTRKPASQRSPLGEQLDAAAVVRASQAISGEMRLPELIDQIMHIVLENAGAERGLLMLMQDEVPVVVAEARTLPGAIDVVVRESPATPDDLPQSVLGYAIRARQHVILEDAVADDVYSNDDYITRNRSKSILCMLIVRQTRVIGVLYLENNLTSGAFTQERLSVIDLLASQAAISLENAKLYKGLQRSETFLAQGQMISNTGSFGWSAASGEFFWSRELYDILEYPPTTKASIELALQRVHPDDRTTVGAMVENAMRQGADFDSDHRLWMPDGRIKHVHAIGRALHNGDLDFVGSVRDVTERVANEEALREVKSDLAHVARVTTLNAMTASIAHEVNQPLSGIITNGHTGMRLLSMNPPDLAGVAETIQRTIRDANRASDVINRLRAMIKKQAAVTELVNLNEAAQEVIVLSTSELQKAKVLVRTEYRDLLPLIRVDRVQLQQVILNLLLNAIEALTDVTDRPREITIRTSVQLDGSARLDVHDAGIGIEDKTMDRLFEPFFTTKATGMGVGLSICRSIIAGLDGQLWVTQNDGPGSTFSFSIPAAGTASGGIGAGDR
ncbi:GAF domain-containing protein [Neorhizobium sp. P12A]|nr:GAF domain-containing protein [Neorhizobium sp. P12A]